MHTSIGEAFIVIIDRQTLPGPGRRQNDNLLQQQKEDKNSNALANCASWQIVTSGHRRVYFNGIMCGIAFPCNMYAIGAINEQPRTKQAENAKSQPP